MKHITKMSLIAIFICSTIISVSCLNARLVLDSGETTGFLGLNCRNFAVGGLHVASELPNWKNGELKAIVKKFREVSDAFYKTGDFQKKSPPGNQWSVKCLSYTWQLKGTSVVHPS